MAFQQAAKSNFKTFCFKFIRTKKQLLFLLSLSQLISSVKLVNRGKRIESIRQFASKLIFVPANLLVTQYQLESPNLEMSQLLFRTNCFYYIPVQSFLFLKFILIWGHALTSSFPGLTWQDDITQQVISRELSKLRSIPLHRWVTPSSPLASYGSSRDRKLKPSQAELNRNLQQYLTSLGFLSQQEDVGQLGVQGHSTNTKVKFSSRVKD